MRHARLFSLVCLLLAGLLAARAGPALAQEEKETSAQGLPPQKDLTQLVYDEWTTEDGLPHRTVGDILQTRDGYL